MKLLLLLFAIFIAVANSFFQLPSCDPCDDDCNDDEEQAKEYVEALNNIVTEVAIKHAHVDWAYETNKTDENKEAAKKFRFATGLFTKNFSSQLRKFAWKEFNDKELVRLATKYFVYGNDVPDDLLKKRSDLYVKLTDSYSKGKVCKFEYHNDPNCTEELDMTPNITKIMGISRNHTELLYYWTEWRKNVGDYLRKDYIEFIKVEQEIAISLGFKNLKEKWMEPYEEKDFPSLMRRAYSETFKHQGVNLSLEIFYKEIHTFVKGKLMSIYNREGAELIKNDGPIPAHLLGNMWAENWEYLFESLVPFPDAQVINVTNELIKQKYQPIDLFKMANNFFVSMGFRPMPQKFWENSMLVKPTDREVECGAAAWDFSDPPDFRISMCTELTHQDLVIVHHEMGHIAYNMEYENLPWAYRFGANPGFHEAIGDLMALAVNTPSYLRKLGLLEAENNSTNEFVVLDDGTQYKKNDINYLMGIALSKIVILPFTLIVDTWRWKYFSGEINETNLNEEYWKLRYELQGVVPPVTRNETNLDPAAKLHVPYHTPYIRYFFSHLLQFQLYEALCMKTKEYDPKNVTGKPLHLCDFSREGDLAGKVLRDMMKKGASENWALLLEKVTGTHHLSGESLVKYFLPLYKYVKQENDKGSIKPWK